MATRTRKSPGWFGIWCALLSPLAVLSGCGGANGAPSAATTQQLNALGGRITALSNQIAQLQNQTTTLRTLVVDLELMKEDRQYGAAVDTTQLAYGTGKGAFGTYLVVPKKVEPYLDGYKVHLMAANLTSANFNGATMTVRWGVAPNEQTRTFDLTTRFPPGYFVPVDAVLSPATAAQVKALTVTLVFNRIGG